MKAHDDPVAIKVQRHRPSGLFSDELDISDKLRSAKPPEELKMTVEDLEQEGEPICSRLEAEATLRKLGIHVMGKRASEMMLIGARHGLIRLIKFFQSKLSPLTVRNEFYDTLYHSAAISGQEKVVFWLLKKGVDPRVENAFGETALHLAAGGGYINIVHMLVKDGRINILHQDKFGDTCLHFAARDGEVYISNYLCRKDADICRIKNHEGLSAIDYAIDAGESGVVACLRSHGAVEDRGDAHIYIEKHIEALVQAKPDSKVNPTMAFKFSTRL